MTAQLDFSGEEGYVYLADDHSCDARRLLTGDDSKSTRITTEGPVWIERWAVSHHGRRRTFCKAAASFVPEAGKTYISDFHRQDGECALQVYRVEASGEKVAEPSAHAEAVLSCGYRFQD